MLFHSLGRVDHQEFPVVLIKSATVIRVEKKALLLQGQSLSDLINFFQRDTVQILLHGKVTFLYITEKFLCMGSCLSTSSSPYVILN
jgi:hypothetical protein